MTMLQEKQGYLRELEELIPQMETLIQDKETLDQQVSFMLLSSATRACLCCTLHCFSACSKPIGLISFFACCL